MNMTDFKESLNYITPEACCAHLAVKYNTAKHPAGGTIGWWACKDCGQRFMPIPMGESGDSGDTHRGTFDSSPPTRTLIEIILNVIDRMMSPGEVNTPRGIATEIAHAIHNDILMADEDIVQIIADSLAVTEDGNAKKPFHPSLTNYTTSDYFKYHAKQVLKVIRPYLHPEAQTSEIPVVDTERCIADDQWAIDAFYKGYDKANADFKENGFTGLKPIIGGIRSLLAAVNAPKREYVEVPDEDVEVAIAEAIALIPKKTDYCETGIPVLKELKKYGWRIIKDIEGGN